MCGDDDSGRQVWRAAERFGKIDNFSQNNWFSDNFSCLRRSRAVGKLTNYLVSKDKGGLVN